MKFKKLIAVVVAALAIPLVSFAGKEECQNSVMMLKCADFAPLLLGGNL